MFLLQVKDSNSAKSFKSYQAVIDYLLEKYGHMNEYLQDILANDPGGELVDDDIEALNNIIDIYINDEINHNDTKKMLEVIIK